MFERPKTSEIPAKPGAYLFRDKNGRVIYAGKAKSLRSRVSSYFGTGLHPRTQTMVDNARSVEWILTESEVAALMLEYGLIKQHRPRFNVKLVDDKSYPYLALTRSDDWPRALVMRGKKRKGNQYFGPYAHTYAIRKTLDQLLRTFPVRTCSNAMFERQKAQGRPCLLFHIEKCSGPCIDEVDPYAYGRMVDGLSGIWASIWKCQPSFARWRGRCIGWRTKVAGNLRSDRGAGRYPRARAAWTQTHHHFQSDGGWWLPNRVRVGGTRLRLVPECSRRGCSPILPPTDLFCRNYYRLHLVECDHAYRHARRFDSG